MTGPRPLGSAALVRLIASREISARVRDKNFIISSVVILVLLLGTLGLHVALNSGGETTTIGVVGDPALGAALGTGRVTHFAWQQPTLVELFREAVAAPEEVAA